MDVCCIKIMDDLLTVYFGPVCCICDAMVWAVSDVAGNALRRFISVKLLFHDMRKMD